MRVLQRMMICLMALGAASSAGAQLRIATWNMTLYGGGREEAIATAVYGEFEGRSLAPDILIAQEMIAGGPDALLEILNDAGPGDWQAAPIPGSEGDSALLYRDTRITLLGATLVAPGGLPPRQPRDVVRWDVRLAGYEAQEATLAIYSSHMKAGSGAPDSARRVVEAKAIRTDAAELPEPWRFLLGGDLNMQRSTEEAWQELTEVQPDNRGRLLDPINTPGTWRDSEPMRFVHTQDPVGAGMDDRFDVILVCRELLEGDGLRYNGDATQRFSEVTWDDPNHSYRVWGNDGSRFDQPLRTTGNSMVGPQIASALREVADSEGHLPVYLELRVPARLQAPAIIDFGVLAPGEVAEVEIEVGNGGDVSLWGGWIAQLLYQMEAPAPVAAPAGTFRDAPGGALRRHTITLHAPLAPGPLESALTITSNAPDDPERIVPVVAQVALCRADLDGDGALTFFDFLAFQELFAAGDLRADFDGDGVLDFFDFLAFQAEFAAGCE